MSGLADFRVNPNDHDAFGRALEQGVTTIIAKSEGYLGHEILACQETRGRWVLLIRWTTTEAHTVGFRTSEAFSAWRALVGPFFAQPPHVEHFDTLKS